MHKEGNIPELLCPASSLEVLETAVIYGADAVYIGGEAFSLRAKAKNFSPEDMCKAVSFAHRHGAKVYVTVNIIAHNDDLEELDDYLRLLSDIKPDALLVADPGVFVRCRRLCPDIPLHVSTQANNVNWETFLFWHGLGAERVVCGRELSLREIREIRDHIPDDLEIEAFVHGAMCISYSGRCLLSSFLAGRDANRGECSHPCRWKYSVVEETRPGQYMPVYENERGTFIFNSKDLCMVEHIPDMVEAGIDSLKIEGRMKTALYVATVARTYRKALDDLKQGEDVYRKNMPWYEQEIRNCTYRDFTTGFFYGKPGPDAQVYGSNTYIRNYIYLGSVLGEKEIDGNRYIEIIQKNKFSVGDMIEIMKPDGRDITTLVEDIRDENLQHMDSAPHPLQFLYILLGTSADRYDILRKSGDLSLEE